MQQPQTYTRMSDTANGESEHGQAVAYVARAKNRRAVLNELANQNGTPTDVGERVGMHQSTAGRAMRELREVGCVELLVPEDTRQGKVHGVTEKGESVLETLGDA